MTSSYPTVPDVLPQLADEFDRPDASWWNALFDGIYKLEVELGADPADLGTGYTSNADLTALLAKFAAVEVGRFKIELPEEAPLSVVFLHPERFTTAGNLIVYVMKVIDGKGRGIWENDDHCLTITTSVGAPVGFEFYLRTMETRENQGSEYLYLAIEDKL